MALKIQPSFAAGELSPSLYGRVDLAKYQVGLRTCINWMIMAQGGAQNRPGTSWVGPQSDHAVRHRTIPFQFNTSQSYALQFGHMNMRVVKDGAFVTETPGVITGATAANPVVISDAGHGYSNGDLIYIDGVEGMTQLNGRFFTAASVAANTYALLGIDGTGYNAYVSGGTGARVYTLATPYAAGDLPLLKYVQSNDTMTLTHPGYAPRDLTRSGHAAWAINAITFASEQPAPTAVSATPSSVAGSDIWSYVITAVNATTGEESLPSTAGTATFKAEFDWDATAGDYIDIAWTDAAGADSYNVYKERNGIYGFIGSSSAGATGFRDDKIRADTTDTPPGSFNPFSGAGDWPSTVTYHEQRKWFGATTNKPQTLWATASGSFKNMNKSTPTQDDDAIVRTLASRQANEIRHLVSMGPLIVFTSGAEWMVWPGQQSDVLTPGNTNARAQSYSGSSHVPPLLIKNTILFVQEKGSLVQDLRYQYESDSWNGVDMSILASHLFEGRTIEEWAWAQVPHKIVWTVRDDGVLLAFTYLKDQEVYAWARHITDGEVESVCTISEGNEDVLYLSIVREVDGATVRYVERMESRVFDQLRNAWFLDCARAYDGNNAVADDYMKISGATYAMGDTVTLTATGHAPFTAALAGRKYELRIGADKVRVTVTGLIGAGSVLATLDSNAAAVLQNVDTADWALLSGLSVSGLWHLEGREVDICADGWPMPAGTVAGGTLAIEREASRVLVGLPYDCDLETLDVDTGLPTIQGKEKRIGEVRLKVDATRGLFVGPSASRLTEIKERTDEPYGEPVALFSGTRKVLIGAEWNSNGRVYIRATPGLPARVLAIIPDVAVGNG